MKNILKNIVIIICVALLISSCKRNFLNTKQLNAISSDVAWTDAGLAQAFVTDIYNGLQNGGFYEQQLASISDEAVFVHPGRGINIINEGTLSPSNLGWQDGTYEWNTMYNRIRPCNLSLENLWKGGFPDQELNRPHQCGQ